MTVLFAQAGAKMAYDGGYLAEAGSPSLFDMRAPPGLWEVGAVSIGQGGDDHKDDEFSEEDFFRQRSAPPAVSVVGGAAGAGCGAGAPAATWARQASEPAKVSVRSCLRSTHRPPPKSYRKRVDFGVEETVCGSSSAGSPSEKASCASSPATSWSPAPVEGIPEIAERGWVDSFEATLTKPSYTDGPTMAILYGMPLCYGDERLLIQELRDAGFENGPDLTLSRPLHSGAAVYYVLRLGRASLVREVAASFGGRPLRYAAGAFAVGAVPEELAPMLWRVVSA